MMPIHLRHLAELWGEIAKETARDKLAKLSSEKRALIFGDDYERRYQAAMKLSSEERSLIFGDDFEREYQPKSKGKE